MSLLAWFYHVDTFCHTFLPHWERERRVPGQRTRRHTGHLALSEVITILVHFHQIRFRDFKIYSLVYVRGQLRREFPHAVSYQRFVALIPPALGPLWRHEAYLRSPCLSRTDVSLRILQA